MLSPLTADAVKGVANEIKAPSVAPFVAVPTGVAPVTLIKSSSLLPKCIYTILLSPSSSPIAVITSVPPMTISVSPSSGVCDAL